MLRSNNSVLKLYGFLGLFLLNQAKNFVRSLEKKNDGPMKKPSKILSAPRLRQLLKSKWHI